MSIAGSTGLLGRCALALFWSAVLCVMLGCSEIADPPDARALRRQFPEQAEAILQGPFAFTLAGDSFEDLRPIEALADLSGEAALRSRFPRHGGGALRLPLPDGSEALVRELGALGEAEIAENAIAYPRRGGTSFWTALQDGYEEWLLLDASEVRRDAPVAIWQIDGAELRQQGEAVELADARGAPQIHVTAPEAYAAGGRPVATRLSARGGRLELWVEAEGEAVLVDPRWKLKREMSTPRVEHTATALPDGRVLVAGGFNSGNHALDTAEVFDPASGAWRTLRMLSAHAMHTATLLPDGRVLVAGGIRDGVEITSVELFDPASDTWLPLPPMHTGRAAHTATLLLDGQVLVAGGVLHPALDELDSAELFDPAARTWRILPPMHTARTEHTATLLRDGRVFVAGGTKGDGIDSVELFDPTSGTWSPLPSMSTAHSSHTATLLPDGQVLVAGGTAFRDGSLFGSAELFDPASGTWRPIDPMSTDHVYHAATLLPDGRVLVTGGITRDGTGASDSSEVFDPASGTWRPFEAMLTARYWHTATLLPDGRVLVVGGWSLRGKLDSVEMLDVASSPWQPLDPMHTARSAHTTTLLSDGRVLVAGGYEGDNSLASAEVFDPASGTWLSVAPMLTARHHHTATLLQDGRVLVAGGYETSLEYEAPADSAEVFDPASGTWLSIAPLLAARSYHTATPLPDGRVLVAGGHDDHNTLGSAEVFDPASGTWLSIAPMLTSRHHHTATLLPDGRVLVAGGDNQDGMLNRVEALDPASGTWLPLAPMDTARFDHSATLLPDGRVLMVGGIGNEGTLDSAEIFDPTSGAWMSLAPMSDARNAHTTTLLPDGNVLVAGGFQDIGGRDYPTLLASVEVLDPVRSTWVPIGSMSMHRDHHTAVLLPNGRVLIVGGRGSDWNKTPLNTAEVFRPVPNGGACSAALECQSGWCADDVCCDQLCNVYLCEACSDYRGATADGVCTSLHPDYQPFSCSPVDGQQTKPCKSVHDCIDGFVCEAYLGDCVLPPPDGGYVDKGGCRLATPAATEPTRRAPAELGLLMLAAASAALRRRRR